MLISVVANDQRVVGAELLELDLREDIALRRARIDGGGLSGLGLGRRGLRFGY